MYGGLPFCNGGTEEIGDEERMSFLFCVAGTALLMISVILCAVTDNDELWITCLIIGEITAFLGYVPIIFRIL